MTMSPAHVYHARGTLDSGRRLEIAAATKTQSACAQEPIVALWS